VIAAGRDSTPKSRAALSELCELYWPPLYAFARRQGHSVEQAQDLTQAFFARLLEKRTVQVADPQRGRFRSFLLTSFKYFVANEHDRERARKRGGGELPVSLDFETVEARYMAEPADALTPEALFERQWARAVLDRVLHTLRSECVKASNESTFDPVKELVIGEKNPGGYAAIADALNTTDGAIKVMIHRFRRRYQQLLRDEIASTVSDEADVDDEIRHLIAVLTR